MCTRALIWEGHPSYNLEAEQPANIGRTVIFGVNHAAKNAPQTAVVRLLAHRLLRRLR
jgi:hypothetical protein